MRAADYVEMTTTSIAGTSGDGAVTCTAITSTPTFTLALGSGACQVRYVIEDTVNKKFETGIGSVASNVLTRSKVQITWDGTTWTSNAPSALQFGSTPTTGNIKIRLAATAESQGVAFAGVNSSITGDTTWRDYPISNNVGWDNGGSNNALTANTEYYTCYELTNAGLLSGIQFDCSSGVSGSMKVALYPVGTNGLPGTKIVDFNVFSVTATAVKTDTTTGTWSPAGPIALVPGWYYVGFISDVACGIRGFASSGSPGPKRRTPLGRQSGYGWGNTVSVAGNYTTGLPATPSPSTMIGGSNTLSVPWFGLKVQA